MTLEEFRKRTAHLPGEAVLVCKVEDAVFPFYGIKSITARTLVCVTGSTYREPGLLERKLEPGNMVHGIEIEG